MDKRKQAKIAIYIVGAFMAIALGALFGTGWPSAVRLPLSLLIGAAASFVMIQLARNLRP